MSVEEAKHQLREAASANSPLAWARRHPKESVLAALVGGFLLAAFPDTCRALAEGYVALIKRRRR